MTDNNDDLVIVGSAPPGLPNSGLFDCYKCTALVAVEDTTNQELIRTEKAQVICITCFRIESGLDPTIETMVSRSSYEKVVKMLGQEATDATLEKHNITIME